MNIIKVKFMFNGEPKGRAYAYFSNDPVAVGDVVQVNMAAKGLVTEIDVPEEEIKDYRDKVKLIHGLHQEPVKKMFDPVKANEAQVRYCSDKGYPHFAPTGKCWKCNKNIYEDIDHGNDYYTGIDVERAGTELITGCPHCNRSYCD